MNLVGALSRFNRKERYWLIKNALGKGSDTLGEEFLDALEDQGIAVPPYAWWAMDYHIDWLVGALLILKLQSEVKYTALQKNDASEKSVYGTQEDIDLIIAFDKTLVLIEAKANTGWNNKQLNSKVKRLRACFERMPPEELELNVYFVLTSPKEPDGLVLDEDVGSCNGWMLRDGKLRWIKLKMSIIDDNPKFFKVVRCGKSGGANGNGSHWKIQK